MNRVHLRRGQFTLRTLMALPLVVASCLALLPLFDNPDMGPLPISKSVKFEVFTVAATGSPNGSSFTNPSTGAMLPVTGPPIITGADVLTIQLMTGEQNRGHAYLNFALRPAGGNKLLRATTAAAGGELVAVLDGEVLFAPKIHAPVGHRFELSGGRLSTEPDAVFNELTAK